MKQARREGDTNAELRPVQELLYIMLYTIV